MFKTFTISALFTLFLAQASFGWGHLKTVASHPRSFLLSSVLTKKQIHYCVEAKPDAKSLGFQVESLQIQIEQALSIWLDEVRRLGGPEVKVDGAICSLDQSQDVDLEVIVYESGEVNRYPYTVTVDFPHPVVFINLSAVLEARQTIFHILDFSKLVPDGTSLPNFLKEVTLTHPQTLIEFSEKIGISPEQAHINTYSILFHEFGHAFGLCDTNAAMKDCDPEHSSGDGNHQPSSVMRNAAFLYLTPDDRDGLSRLYQRYTR